MECVSREAEAFSGWSRYSLCRAKQKLLLAVSREAEASSLCVARIAKQKLYSESILALFAFCCSGFFLRAKLRQKKVENVTAAELRGIPTVGGVGVRPGVGIRRRGGDRALDRGLPQAAGHARAQEESRHAHADFLVSTTCASPRAARARWMRTTQGPQSRKSPPLVVHGYLTGCCVQKFLC